jgi:acyl-CoA thioester hydrolase
LDTSPLNVHEFRVRTHQTDLNAAMYHGAYFDIFDDARIETFRRMGYTYERMKAGGWTTVIRRIDCEFYAAGQMDDLLTVTVCIPGFTPATMKVRYLCCHGDLLVATAHAVFAFVNALGKPIRVPPDLREVVNAYRELITES